MADCTNAKKRSYVHRRRELPTTCSAGDRVAPDRDAAGRCVPVRHRRQGQTLPRPRHGIAGAFVALGFATVMLLLSLTALLAYRGVTTLWPPSITTFCLDAAALVVLLIVAADTGRSYSYGEFFLQAGAVCQTYALIALLRQRRGHP